MRSGGRDGHPLCSAGGEPYDLRLVPVEARQELLGNPIGVVVAILVDDRRRRRRRRLSTASRLLAGEPEDVEAVTLGWIEKLAYVLDRLAVSLKRAFDGN